MGKIPTLDPQKTEKDPQKGEAFLVDLKRVRGYAAVVWKTETPTPEQVFGLFEEIFPDEE